MNPDENIECPFCGEDDFDLIGLRIHLAMGWCDEYGSINVRKEIDRRISEVSE